MAQHNMKGSRLFRDLSRSLNSMLTAIAYTKGFCARTQQFIHSDPNNLIFKSVRQHSVGARPLLHFCVSVYISPTSACPIANLLHRQKEEAMWEVRRLKQAHQQEKEDIAAEVQRLQVSRRLRLALPPVPYFALHSA